MKECLLKTLAVSIFAFSLASVASADTSTLPCGNIIGPDAQYSQTIVTKPIVDCTDPFLVTKTVVSPYTLKINGTAVENNTSIAVVGGKTSDVVVSGRPILSDYTTRLYKHENNNYVYINQNPLPMQDADYIAYANSYFSDSVSRQLYIEIYNASDRSVYLYDSEGNPIQDDVAGVTRESRFYSYMQSAENSFKPKTPEITSGTYTMVIHETLYILNKGNDDTFLHRFLSGVIKTAEAYDYPDYYFTITFTLSDEVVEPTGASSVLFLPGIESSRLYTNGLLGTEDQLWEANNNQDVTQLAMTVSGVSINQIYTRDIADKAYYRISIYDGFIKYMDSLVNGGIINNWAPFAYDWRYSVDDIANNGTQYQNEVKNAVDEVQRLAESSFTGKVTIIGHSNGGLLAKALMIRLAELNKSNLVDTVVLVASPQLGTPKAIASMLHGFDQEIGYGPVVIVDDKTARDSMVNMPGAYGLIPSLQYFNTSTNTLIKFDNSSSTKVFRNAYGSSIDSVAELTKFMSGTGDNRVEATTIDEAMRTNGTLLQKQLSLHANSLDNWVAPAGVKVIEVVGTGLDTISGFEYREFTERACTLFQTLFCANKVLYKPVPLISQFGDKTVMTLSAEGYKGNKEQYFIDLKKIADLRKEDSVEHYNILENPSIKSLINNILKNSTSTIDFITKTPSITTSNRIMFGTHSPVNLEIKDKQGRRVSKDLINGLSTIVTDIPGSSYFELGSSSYIIVPDGTAYDVNIKGTNQGGLTFTVDTLNGEVQKPLFSVAVATITPSTTVTTSYNTVLSNLSVDQNGDGMVDQILTPLGIDVTPKITYINLRDAIQKLSLTPLRKAPLLLLVIASEKFDKNPKLSTLEALTLKELETLLDTYLNNKWITASDSIYLKGIINKLK